MNYSLDLRGYNLFLSELVLIVAHSEDGSFKLSLFDTLRFFVHGIVAEIRACLVPRFSDTLCPRVTTQEATPCYFVHVQLLWEPVGLCWVSL